MTPVFDVTTIIFVVNAIIGATLNVLMWSKKQNDLHSWKAIKTILIGAIAGYIYWWGYETHGFPDGFMSIIVGYASEDFIDWVISKFTNWKPAKLE